MSERQSVSRLSAKERARLQACEEIIQKGLRTFVEVGLALAEIRTQKLYREECETFQQYCRSRWQMSPIHAHRLIEAASTAQNLLPIGNIPTHESQVRPLTGLSQEQQRKAWEIATQQNPNPAATTVQAAVQSLGNGQWKETISSTGTHRIDLGRVEIEMSLEDQLADLEFNYVQKACSIIEERAQPCTSGKLSSPFQATVPIGSLI